MLLKYAVLCAMLVCAVTGGGALAEEVLVPLQCCCSNAA
jgi:hypothetical protein